MSFFFVVLKAFDLTTPFAIATFATIVELAVAVYAIVRLCRKEDMSPISEESSQNEN